MKFFMIAVLSLVSFSTFAGKPASRISKAEAKEICLSKDSTLSGKKLYRCIKKTIKKGY